MENKLEIQSGGAVEIITNKANVMIQIQQRQIEIERQRCFPTQQIRIRRWRDIIVVIVVVVVAVDVVVVAIDHWRQWVAIAVAIFRNDGRSPWMVPFPAIHNGFHGPWRLLWSRLGLAKRLLPSHYRFFRNWGHCKEKLFSFSQESFELEMTFLCICCTIWLPRKWEKIGKKRKYFFYLDF